MLVHRPCGKLCDMSNHTTFGERMKEARKAAGPLSVENATYAARDYLPRALWFSTETLRRMESGETAEEKADPFLVGVLARVYGVALSELSPIAAKALEDYRDQVISTMRCIWSWPGQQRLFAAA